jgi:UDP-glucose 4-epimerase
VQVVVTGACGRLGSVVVRLLCDDGVDVRAVDLEEAPTALRRLRKQEFSDPGIVASPGPAGQLTYRQVNLTDLGQVYGVLAGASAVIHLGAIPSPAVNPPDVVFRNNVLAQFNVFEAAATLGIRRVVSASSVSALGFPWQHRWSEPLYFPIDELHPLLPQDAYGLSKALGEEIAAAYGRRGAGSTASLRFSTILSEDAYAGFISRVRRDVQAHARLL